MHIIPSVLVNEVIVNKRLFSLRLFIGVYQFVFEYKYNPKVFLHPYYDGNHQLAVISNWYGV